MLEHIEEKHEDEIEEIDIEPEQGADGATKEELLNKMRDDIRKRKQARMGREVEEKFHKENFRVNREMRDEILVYDLFLTKF